MIRRLEALTLGAGASVALVVTTLDLVGVLDQVDWLRSRVPVLTLLVAGLACAHLSVRHLLSRREMDAVLGEAVRRIQMSVDGIEFRQFDTAADYWRYAGERIGAAVSSVDDITWGAVAPTQVSTDTAQAYNTYRRLVASVGSGRGRRSRVVYREMMSFPDGRRIDRVRDLLDSRYPNYHLRYYDFDHDGTPPMLQFFVIDQTEILLTVQSKTTSSSDNKHVAIRNDKLARVMSHFFELAWRDGLILKDMDGIRGQAFGEIQLRFRNLEDIAPA